MIKLQLLFGFATFALWVYCLVSVIQTPEGAVRNLQRTIWLLIVLLFPFVGSIAWLVAGRPETAPRRPSAHERPATGFPERDRPRRSAAVDANRDAEFLEGVRARAEEQRKRAREQQRAKGEQPASGDEVD